MRCSYKCFNFVGYILMKKEDIKNLGLLEKKSCKGSLRGYILLFFDWSVVLFNEIFGLY